MRPLVHLKQVNTEYNCNTTLKEKKCQYRARAYYPFHTVPSDITTIGDTKIFNVKMISKYKLRCTESCLRISVSMNMYF